MSSNIRKKTLKQVFVSGFFHGFPEGYDFI